MADVEKEQDLALLAYLRGSRSTGTSSDVVAQADAPVLGDEVDWILRGMGLNRIEREEIRRPKARRASKDRYRATTLKRFAYYIAQRLPDLTPERAAELTNEWASLTSYDVELAQRWWTSGVNPNDPGQLAQAVADGLQVQDLGKVLSGRTIAEHLQAGNSLTWCLQALHWQRAALQTL